MTRFLQLLAALCLASAPSATAPAQTDPPPDVADTIDEALQDTAVPAEAVGASRIDPETVRVLEEMFGAEGIAVVDDPQQVTRAPREPGLQVEVVTPGAPQIQPYSPNAGGGSDWLGKQIASAEYMDQHQREQEQKRAALRVATGVVIVIGILVLMLRKPWASRELPRPAPPPPAPDEEPPAPDQEA